MRRDEKARIVQELAQKISKSSSILIFNVYNLPTPFLQEIRKKLRGKAELKVVKRRLLEKALEQAGKQELKNFLPLQPAVLLAQEKPFKLMQLVETLEFRTFAEEGSVVKEDVVVNPGPTGLSAGPAIGEFVKVGIPVGVEAGKIVVKKGKTILRANEKVSPELVPVLRKLGIKPVSISLKIHCMLDGFLYTPETLEFARNVEKELSEAQQKSLSLTLALGWPTPENINYLLLKAYQEAKLLG